MSRYLRPIVERGKKTRAGSASEIIWLAVLSTSVFSDMEVAKWLTRSIRWRELGVSRLSRAPTQPRIDLAVHQATEPPIRPLEKRWKNKD